MVQYHSDGKSPINHISCAESIEYLIPTFQRSGQFLSLEWETILEGGWTTSWPKAWRCGKETGILPHYFPWRDFKFYIKKEEDKWKPSTASCHKSGPANKLRNPTTEIISDLNSNCQLPKPGDRKNYKTCWKCRVNDERPTGKKTTCEWDDGGKINN